MRTPRSLSPLLLILGVLAMLATPVTAIAGGPSKKAPVTAKKSGKVDKARSAAAKKGWETRRMNQKAEANWASRTGPNAKNPKPNTPEAKATFIRQSVAAQRGWQKRTAASQTGKKKVAKQTGKKKVAKQTGKKVAKQTGKKASKKAGQTGKKTSKKTGQTGKKAASKGTEGEQAKAAAAAEPNEQGMIENAGVGNKDFQNGLAKFDEARFATGEGREQDAAEAQMEGHDKIAKAAFATADAYQAAGRVDEANKLIEFGNQHVAQADALEAALDQMQPQRGPIGRFFSWLNPFKKRGGNSGGDDDEVRVAGE